MRPFNAKQVLIEAFVSRLEEAFTHIYGGLRVDHVNTLRTSATLAMETITNSTALYHDVEHSMMVGMVGQEILRGRFLREGNVSADDWLNVTIALLFHDIGYVQGVCPGDRPGVAVIDDAGDTVELPPGSTDAFLTPWHVERGKIFIRWRFRHHPLVDCELVRACIENTRFPIPARNDTTGHDWPSLVRCADLIGQMADPDYLRKLPGLFHEFEETGTNARLGNRSPADLRRNYPTFYWNGVHHHIQDGLRYLEMTADGRRWIASLLSNVFVQEHSGRKAS